MCHGYGCAIRPVVGDDLATGAEGFPCQWAGRVVIVDDTQAEFAALCPFVDLRVVEPAPYGPLIYPLWVGVPDVWRFRHE